MPAARENRTWIGMYILGCLALWLFVFRGFVFGHLSLDSDAISYYDHIRFYIQNITKGVFPLWDPLWMSGSPNEFFLRRICPYNPFFVILAILSQIPISYKTAYLLYLSGYYFLGMFGFYLLSETILKNKMISFLAFVFLLFSGLGVRIFDSYFIFVSTPLIWFFYFFLNWIHTPKRSDMVGMTFCAMILFSTYIPFYFIVIFCTFLIFFCLVYADKVYDALKRIFRFLKLNKLLTAVCLAAILCSLVPGYTFFKDSKKGDFVFPQRHANFADQSQLSVSYDAITSWTSIEDLHYSSNFKDLKKYKSAVFYLPGYIFFLLFLGLFTKLNRKLILMALWMGFIVIMCSPHAPIYKYLYDHVFFFKYFRNLHFFLWFILTPVFVIFVCEQFRQIYDVVAQRIISKRNLFVLNVAAHVVYLVWILFGAHHGLVTSYIIVGLSFVVWSMVIIMPKVDPRITLILFLALIICQPLEIYYFFTKDYAIRDSLSFYDKAFKEFETVADNDVEEIWKKGGAEAVFDYAPSQLEIYYASGAYNFINKIVQRSILMSYANQKIYLYDNTQLADDASIDSKTLSYFLGLRKNLAFVDRKNAVKTHGQADSLARWITKDDKDVRIVKFDSNSLELKLNLDQEKFLVWTDSHHPSWRAWMDGRPVDVVRANVAFKGLWVLPGEHRVVFHFKTAKDYLFNYFLMIAYFCIFICLLMILIKDKRIRDWYESVV